jgi:NAD(P)-dependent dehydrogenase (short-subunit alcohol dehydrogenase family)
VTGRLAGKVALISGAARGIGADVARLFAEQGASVMLADIRDDEGQAVAAAITKDGGSAAYRHLDVRSRAEWDAARDEAERLFGPVDVLVSNAFRMTMPALADLSDTEWTASLEVNLTGGYHGIRSVLPGMRARGRGSIVVVSATNGNEVALPVNAAYQGRQGGAELPGPARRRRIRARRRPRQCCASGRHPHPDARRRRRPGIRDDDGRELPHPPAR